MTSLNKILTIALLFSLTCFTHHTFAAVITKAKLLHNISRRESGHDWTAENHSIYIGQWQMDRSALRDCGYSSQRVRYIFTHFPQNPYVFPATQQRIVINIFFAHLEAEMQPELRHPARRVCGVKLSKAGILASAHSVGTTNLKMFLRSHHNRYRTRILSILRKYEETEMSESFLI